MKIQQTLQKCLDDWNRISGLDFCILDENDQIYISTGDRRTKVIRFLLPPETESCHLPKSLSSSVKMLLYVFLTVPAASTN